MKTKVPKMNKSVKEAIKLLKRDAKNIRLKDLETGEYFDQDTCPVACIYSINNVCPVNARLKILLKNGLKSKGWSLKRLFSFMEWHDTSERYLNKSEERITYFPNREYLIRILKKEVKR